MIQAFQKFSQSRVAKVFLAIVALSFMAFFGGGSWFRPHDPHAVVAEVGSLSIGRYEFAEKVQKQMQRIMAESGNSMNREDILKEGFPQMILAQLIQETLLNLEAAQLGLTVSDETLRQFIHSMKAFQNDKGVFERALFVQILHANGLSEDTFIADVRAELIREELKEAIIVGVSMPEGMINRLFDAQYQYRQASMLLVSPEKMPIPPAPSKEALEVFYTENQKEFVTPELRTLSAFVIDPTTFSKDIPVTDEEIKAVYEAKPEAFDNKPLEEVKKLVVLDIQKEKANEKAYQLTQDLDDKIAGGTTFEELAPLTKEASFIKLDSVDANGQDRLDVSSPQLPKDKEFAQELLQTGFSLEENMDSPFSQAKNGAYYTVRVDKITPAALPFFADIQDRVLKMWTKAEQFKAAKAKAEEYVNTFNQGNKQVSLMTLLPNLSLSEPSPSISDNVKNLVFSLRPKQAGMTFIPEGFVVVVMNTIIPPNEKTREDKMASFQEALLKQYKDDVLMAYLNALRIRYPVKVNKGAIQALFAPQEEK
ncbi:MAG: SurA N-terminal domain-containing protein [Proteobacteria bacterium]|nr:SurA N-terminal domain-containing protein [Pseudomonadota bacterium]